MTTATCWGSMQRVRVRISLRLMLIRSVSESHHLDFEPDERSQCLSIMDNTICKIHQKFITVVTNQ